MVAWCVCVMCYVCGVCVSVCVCVQSRKAKHSAVTSTTLHATVMDVVNPCTMHKVVNTFICHHMQPPPHSASCTRVQVEYLHQWSNVQSVWVAMLQRYTKVNNRIKKGQELTAYTEEYVRVWTEFSTSKAYWVLLALKQIPRDWPYSLHCQWVCIFLWVFAARIVVLTA